MAILKIDKKPLDSDTHTWADYIELLALVNMDGVCTAEGAVDRLFDIPGGGRGDMHSANDDDDLDEEADPETDGDVESEDAEGHEPIASKRRRSRARFEARVRDAFALTSWRNNAYGNQYPFELDEANRSLKLVAELSEQNFLYLFLLISANLRFVHTDDRKLTDGFERVASVVMKDVLPARAEVHIFGKATAARYTGSAHEKISSLCGDIRATLIASADDFRGGDSGDSGIDIVGWHSLEDEQGNILVYFAQCACSRSGWAKKQLEASPAMLSGVLHCSAQWTTMMFVPVCFRSVGGAWAVATAIAGVVFIDRLRMLKNCVQVSDAVSDQLKQIVAEVRSSEAIV